jgi:hypothetical protein
MDFFSFSDPGWSQTEDTEKLFSRIAPIDGRLSLDEHVSVRERGLPMYENVRLLSLTSDKWEAGLRVCYLTYEDDLMRLNGTSPPIHEVNAKAPIKLTDENVLYYLSFFCFFVRGEEGPFYVVHDLEDELLPEGFADVRSRMRHGTPSPRDLFRRPRLFGRDDKANWRASALIHYSNALFLADFLVYPTGMVEMFQDEPLLSDLTCRVNAPLAPSAHLA